MAEVREYGGELVSGTGGVVIAAEAGSCVWHPLPDVIPPPGIVQSISGFSTPSVSALQSSIFQLGATLEVMLKVTGFVAGIVILILAFVALGSGRRRSVAAGSLIVALAILSFFVLGSDALLGVLIAIAGGALLIRRR